jgi:hypothetical protein
MLRFKWSVMYLYTTVQVISHVFVNYFSSDHSCISIKIHDWSLEQQNTNVWLPTSTVVYKNITDHLNSSIVMYLYTTVQVSGHVFVYYGSNERSCICILRFKWSVMYLNTTVQVISHVFVYYSSSDQSCICILRFKSSVMYLYTTVQVIHDCSLQPWYKTTWLITWTVVYKNMTDHLNRSIQIHDWSLEP